MPQLVLDSADGVPALRDRISTSTRALCLTGAGLGVGSGLPTFRGDGGIYEGDTIADFHHASQLPDSLDRLWAFWGPVRGTIEAAQPNAGHLAIAEWQQRASERGCDVTLVTQNVDDLHERAGSPVVWHLHGDLFTVRCVDDECTFPRTRDAVARTTPPRCPACGNPLRPDTVLFGEQVDVDAQWAAKRSVRECDLFLAVGTSGVVTPASGLVRYARDVGALRICVDPGDVANPFFDVHIRMKAEDALPLLLS
jgi:NAD-dependent deacetylase